MLRAWPRAPNPTPPATNPRRRRPSRPIPEDTRWPSQGTLIGVAVLAILVVSLGLHEMAHAAAAYWRGDDTAKKLGRMTPNPIKHIDPIMTVALPAFLWFVLPALTGAPRMIFGGAKPVPVVPSRLPSRHLALAIVARAGPLVNVLPRLACPGVADPGHILLTTP